uniref:CG2446 CG2446-PC n=1 Tax=Hypsiglena sp. JMG-2014 TaxID=1550645 RepID=A0A098M168_9SAUR
MAGKSGLYACTDPTSWEAVLNVYQDVIEAMGSKKKKLIALDQWYQEELPKILAGRKEKYLTKEELLKLMEWKLTRGKFRPRLQQLVAANPSKIVEEQTRKAFHQLPDVEMAVKDLNELKGVGPATASAILAAGAPEIAAFMADEVMETLPGLGPVQYSLKHYLLYMDKIQSCVKKLNKGNTTETWTAHLVEKCLWTWALAEKLRLPSLPIVSREEDQGDGGEQGNRARKKQRTR